MIAPFDDGTDLHGSPCTGDSVARARVLADVKVRLGLHTDGPPSLGRYVLLRRLGSGGQGIVHEAYDRELDRKVAIKVLRSDDGARGSPAALLREARALAQLTHPNVVAIHDVATAASTADRAGSRQRGVYLVMEHVDGVDLRTWLRERPRRWHEIVEVFTQAGRGLAAAHRSGIVHRDFKPTNVLLGRDGRPRVVDFGIAFASVSHDDTTSSHAAGAVAGDGTGTGLVVGTPRYMAPEQHLGSPLGPAADQYAFCIALWEALAGEPPFRGDTMVPDKLRGPPPWPRGVDAPTRVETALQRGLAPDPEHRFASMTELLAVLTTSLHRSRHWRTLVAVVVVAGLAALGWGAWSAHRAERCTGARAELADTWGATQRAEVEAALLAQAPYASALWERLAPRLDGYADAWVAMHTEACTATSIRGEQSSAVLDLRMRCLSRARRELAAAVTLLTRVDADVLARAHVLVEELPRLSHCADVDALALDVPPPATEDAATVAAIEATLLEVTALRRAGKDRDALDALDQAAAELEHISYPPLEASITHERARLLDALGRNEDAEAAFRELLAIASRDGQWNELSEAAAVLASLHAEHGARFAEAIVYLEFAQLAAERSDDLRLLAKVHDRRGIVRLDEGKHTEAEAEFRKAIDLHARAPNGDSVRLANYRGNLANAYTRTGKYEEAALEQRAALRIYDVHLGPEHPFVAKVHNNLAVTLGILAKPDDAIAHAREALRILERALGTDHLDVAKVRANIGLMLHNQGLDVEGEAMLRRAVARLEAEPSPVLHVVRQYFARVLVRRQRFAEAEVQYRAALDASTDSSSSSSARAAAHQSFAEGLLEMRRAAEAEAELRIALALWPTADRGADLSGDCRSVLGAALSEQGRHAEAVAELQDALPLLESSLGAEHSSVGLARRRLAVALRGVGRTREADNEFRRAIAIAERGNHRELTETRLRHAVFLREGGELAEARSQLEQAWVAVADDTSSPLRAETAFELARVLWGQAEQAEARRWAAQARRGFEACAPAWHPERDAVAAWLRSHE